MSSKVRISILGAAVLFAAFHVSTALAAAPKPPKSLCVDWDSYGDFQILQIKSLGSTNTAPGKVAFYGVAGYSYSGLFNPVGGGGYMTGTTFNASFSGLTTGGTSILYRLTFDTATNTGSIQFDYHSSNGTTVTDGSSTVTGVDCSTLTVPGAP